MKARPTTYNGIEMRSRLEARVAAWLTDEVGVDWEYEPRAFASGSVQYLPDFLIKSVRNSRGESVNFYLDVKGTLPQGDEFDRFIERLAVIHVSDPTAVVGFATGQQLEMGIVLVLRSSGVASTEWLVECPHHHENLFITERYGFAGAIAWVGRCGKSCMGAMWTEDSAMPERVCLREWTP